MISRGRTLDRTSFGRGRDDRKLFEEDGVVEEEEKAFL